MIPNIHIHLDSASITDWAQVFTQIGGIIIAIVIPFLLLSRQSRETRIERLNNNNFYQAYTNYWIVESKGAIDKIVTQIRLLALGLKNKEVINQVIITELLVDKISSLSELDTAKIFLFNKIHIEEGKSKTAFYKLQKAIRYLSKFYERFEKSYFLYASNSSAINLRYTSSLRDLSYTITDLLNDSLLKNSAQSEVYKKYHALVYNHNAEPFASIHQAQLEVIKKIEVFIKSDISQSPFLAPIDLKIAKINEIYSEYLLNDLEFLPKLEKYADNLAKAYSDAAESTAILSSLAFKDKSLLI